VRARTRARARNADVASGGPRIRDRVPDGVVQGDEAHEGNEGGMGGDRGRQGMLGDDRPGDDRGDSSSQHRPIPAHPASICIYAEAGSASYAVCVCARACVCRARAHVCVCVFASVCASVCVCEYTRARSRHRIQLPSSPLNPSSPLKLRLNAGREKKIISAKQSR
jgi:hypothetical protein